MGDSFIISGLRRKHAEILGHIAALEREVDQLRADLVHIDATLRLLVPGIDLEEIPIRHRPHKRSPYFARGEITRTCMEAFRQAGGDGWLSADEIAVLAMVRKGLDPERDRRLRTDFVRRILQTLDSLERRYGRVAKSGSGRGIRWRLSDGIAEPQRQEELF
jgi:hypothetical protein